MNIKTIVIEGVKGSIEIARAGSGAMVTAGREVIAEIDRGDSREDLYAKAALVAGFVYGTDRKGRPAATNSMIHDVMNEIERVAGC